MDLLIRHGRALLLVAAVGAFSMASAVDLSIGGGVYYAGDGGGGLAGIYMEGYDDGEWYESWGTVPWQGFGFGVFLDASYVEAGIGLTFGSGNPEERSESERYVEWEKNKNIKASFTSLNLSVLGKYPIPLSGPLTVYPAAGIDYAVVLSGESKYEESKGDFGDPGMPDAGDFSAFWFKFGFGIDYNINDRTFIRFEPLYGIRFANEIEDDRIRELLREYSGYRDINIDIDPALGHGWTIKLGIGYRL
jgi:hypothetical protein